MINPLDTRIKATIFVFAAKVFDHLSTIAVVGPNWSGEINYTVRLLSGHIRPELVSVGLIFGVTAGVYVFYERLSIWVETLAAVIPIVAVGNFTQIYSPTLGTLVNAGSILFGLVYCTLAYRKGGILIDASNDILYSNKDSNLINLSEYGTRDFVKAGAILFLLSFSVSAVLYGLSISEADVEYVEKLNSSTTEQAGASLYIGSTQEMKITPYQAYKIHVEGCSFIDTAERVEIEECDVSFLPILEMEKPSSDVDTKGSK